MHTFKNVGIAGGAVTVLFSATFAGAATGAPVLPVVPTTATTAAPVMQAAPAMHPRAMEASRLDGMREQRGKMNAENNVRVASTTLGRPDMMMRKEEGRTKVEEQKEKAKTHIANIKNKEKARMAENIAMQFDRINKVETDHFLKLLGQYSALLQKVQNRAAVDAGKGKDVTATRAAITSAQSAIENARAAVALQAAKTYVLDTTKLPTTATSTASVQDKLMKGLRASFNTLHTQLKADLTAIRDGVMKDARTSVQNAVKTLGPIPGGDNEGGRMVTPPAATTTPTNR